MGAGMFVVFENPVAGINPSLGMDGKAILRRLDELERLAIEADTRSLGSYISANPDDVAAFAETEGVDLDTFQLPPEQWYSPAEALRSVVVLRARLDAHPLLQADAALLRDLEALENLLAEAHRHNVRFHLAMDIP